jgi:chromosomal replication initiation ATPase DnaA
MHTFASFLVSDSSRTAFAAALAVSEHSDGAPNPLFICGPTGSGKSHLLQAIADRVRSLRPHARVYARLELTRRAAEFRSLPLPDDALHYLAEKLTGTPRVVQSVIARISAEVSI